MTTHNAALAASSAAGEKNDCAVRAIAIALDLEYDFVRGVCHAVGRTPLDGTPRAVIRETLYKLHWHLVRIPELSGLQVKVAERKLAADQTYLINTKKHIHCHKNGKSQDHAAGSRCRVIDVERLEQWHCVRCNTIAEVSTQFWPDGGFFAWPDGGFFGLPEEVAKLVAVGLRMSRDDYMRNWGPIKLCRPCFDGRPIARR